MEDINLVKLQNFSREETSRARVEAKDAPPEWRIWLSGFLVIIAAGILFSMLAEEVLEKEAFSWDAPIMLAIHQYSVPWLDTLMMWVSDFGLPRGLLVAAIGAWLWYRMHRITALALVVSYGGSFLIGPTIKLVFTRARPAVFTPLVQLQDFSFPSGHTLGAVTFYGIIAYLCWRNHHYLWALLSVLVASLIAFSRIYLGAHYPSDVLGAIALGIAWIGVVLMGLHLVTIQTPKFKLFKAGSILRLAPNKSTSEER